MEKNPWFLEEGNHTAKPSVRGVAGHCVRSTTGSSQIIPLQFWVFSCGSPLAWEEERLRPNKLLLPFTSPSLLCAGISFPQISPSVCLLVHGLPGCSSPRSAFKVQLLIGFARLRDRVAFCLPQLGLGFGA